MTDNPKISIVTPVWNGIPYLKECVESVLSQDFQEWELIISDNGSTDGSRDYLDSLTDPRIRVHKQEKNLGIFGNLNFLFEQASAEFTQILCADDYLLSGGLSVILEEWNKAPQDIVSLRFNRTPKSHQKYPGFGLLPRTMTPETSTLCYFLWGCAQGNLSNVTVRTRIVADSGHFRPDLTYVGDWEFWARMSKNNKWLYCALDVVHVRQHSGQASSYLAKGGLLATQSAQLMEILYRDLPKNARNWMFRLHASIYYTRYITLALKELIDTRRIEPLRVTLRAARSGPYFGGFVAMIIYVITLRGRIGRRRLGEYLYKRFLTSGGN